MIDTPIHKLVQPLPQTGLVENLILCGKGKVVENRMRFAKSINDATCPDCWNIWKNKWCTQSSNQ